MKPLTQHDTRAIAEATDMFLATACQWQEKANPGYELFCLNSYIQNRLRFALREERTVAAGVQHFADSAARVALGRIPALVRQIYVLGQAPWPDSPSCSAFHLLTDIHCLWLLGEFGAAHSVAEVFSFRAWTRWMMAGGLWTEYANGTWALTSGAPWQPRTLRLRGYDSHWWTYINLLSVWHRGEDDAAARARVAESFMRRNRDKRLVADVDGDGRFPVFWDFRLESMLRFADYRRRAAEQALGADETRRAL
jgi:hypothetical protein